MGASRWLDANTPGGVINSKLIARATKDLRFCILLSLTTFIPLAQDPVGRSRSGGSSCTIGTKVTHIGLNRMATKDQYFESKAALILGSSVYRHNDRYLWKRA